MRPIVIKYSIPVGGKYTEIEETSNVPEGESCLDKVAALQAIVPPQVEACGECGSDDLSLETFIRATVRFLNYRCRECKATLEVKFRHDKAMYLADTWFKQHA